MIFFLLTYEEIKSFNIALQREVRFQRISKQEFAQSAGAVEYTDFISAEG